MFENLPELENFMQEDTKTAITSTARYICDKFERIHDIFKEEYGSFFEKLLIDEG